MVRPPTRTARVASLNRAPWHVGHSTVMSGRYCTSRSMSPRPRHVGHWPSRVLNEKWTGLPFLAPGRWATPRTGGVSGRRPRSRSPVSQRAFWPMGDASIWTTWRMPPRSRARTWPGSAAAPSSARAAGTRLSRTRAVFPAPDGPASAVSRCSGKAAVTPCRLIQVADLQGDPAARFGRPGVRRRAPVPADGRRARQEGAHDGARVGHELVRGALGDNRAAVRPGGRAELDDPVRGADEFRSCSTTTTELPFAARAAIVRRSPSTLLGAVPRTARRGHRACPWCWPAPSR